MAIRHNLELKTWPKQLLDYLPLDFALPDEANNLTVDEIKILNICVILFHPQTLDEAENV
jgi:hypothetical protein